MTDFRKNGKIRILIADDQNTLRDLIRRCLVNTQDMDVVGEAPNLNQALREAQVYLPDVVIMNDYLPPMTSAHATALFRKQGFSAAILATTEKLEKEIIQHSFRHGVNGFMHKQEIDEFLVEAVRSVHEGQRYLSPRARELYGGYRR